LAESPERIEGLVMARKNPPSSTPFAGHLLEGTSVDPRKKQDPTELRKADAILVGDIHSTLRQPICRTDDFGAALFAKLYFIRSLQAQHGCPVLQPGDFMDRWYLGKGEQWLMTELIKLVENYICVPGQHDLPQHNLDLYHLSSLALLEETWHINVLKNDGFCHIEDDIRVEGFPWGSKPMEFPRRKGGYKRVIALIHRMTYLSKPPYPGADIDGGNVESLMSTMKGFDLILTGDNHETFISYDSDINQLLVNPGSLMRSTAKQMDHEPCCYLWFAEENDIERVIIPHAQGVVTREHIDIKGDRDERIQNFVKYLEGEVDLDLSFRENVLRHIKKNKITQPVEEILLEVLE